ncbi:hypothetical protein LCGC14_2821170, partial [marine sediment metagenome]
MKVVEINDLTVQYPGVKALDNVSFLINEGDFLGIIGPNGAGKSTLVRNLSRRPDSGKVLLDGKEVVINSPLDSMRLGIGISHQNLSKSLVDRHTVAENILSIAEGKL